MTETSDTYPTITDPTPDPIAAVGLFPCPACDRIFPSAAALQGHSMMHKPVVPCPECGKEYKTPGALGNHRKMQHGVQGPWAEKQAAKEAKPLGRPKGGGIPRKKRASSLFTADDIVQGALATLWPQGMVPVEAMIPLIEWRDATIEFLEKINE